MANAVDRRIVEMRFDNQQFEQGVKATMNTLDRLKNALKFKGGTEGLKQISQAAKDVSLNSLAESVDYVASRYTALGIVGVTALQRLTNSAITAGTNLVKSLTVEPVMTGMEEYETKMKSIQTILTNTKSKGTTLEDVTSALDELNHYADKTIYNFAEMTRNIGTFTAAGVGLEDATTAIKGISNLGAGSGSTPQQVATAMYQLSQALAAGKVSLQDWNSVVNAGMGGEYFQNALRETAKEMGVVVDETQNFRESISSKDGTGWLTSDILLKTLTKFADDPALEEAATRVKTLTDLIGTMQESVQSGWAESWEYIIGDLDEASNFFTAISQGFDKIMGDSSAARNAMLKVWHDNGGRDALIKALSRIWVGFRDIYYITRGVWQEMFPPMTGEKLIKLTKQFRDLFDGFTFSIEAAEGLRVVLRLLLLPLKGVSIVISTIAKVALFSARKIAQFVNMILEFIGTISLSIQGATGYIVSIEKLNKVLELLGTIGRNVAGAFLYGVNGVREFFGSFVSPLNINGTGIELKGLLDILKGFSDLVLDNVIWGLEKLSALSFSDVQTFFFNLASTAREKFTGFVTFVKQIPLVTQALDKLRPILEGAKENLINFKMGAIEAGESVVQFFKDLKSYEFSWDKFDILTRIKDKVLELKGSFDEFKSGIDISGKIDAITSSIKKLYDFLLDFVDGMDLSTLGVIGFGGAVVYTMIKIAKGVSSIGGFFDSASDMIGGISDAISSFGKEEETNADKFVKFAKAIAILAGSLALLASVDQKALVTSAITIGALVAALVGIAGVVSVLEKFDKIGNIGGIGKPLLMIAGAVAILAGALALLANIPTDDLNGLFIKAGILATLMAAMGGIAGALATFAPQLSKGSVFFIAFAISAKKIVEALQVLAEADNDKIAKALPNMFKMMAGLAVLAIAVGRMKFGSAAGVILLVLSLTMLQKALEKIADSDMNSEKVKANIDKFIVIFGGLAALMASTRLAGKNALQGGAAMILITASLHIVIGAIKKLGAMNPIEMVKGLLGVTAIFAAFAGVIAVTYFAGKNAMRAAGAIAILSVASLLIVQIVKQLGKMEPAELAKGLLAMTAISAIFAGLMYATSFTKGASFGSIVALTAAIGILMVGLGLLTTLDPAKLVVAALSIATVVAAFAGAIFAAGKIQNNDGFKTMIVMLISLAASAASLYILARLPWQGLIAAGIALGAVMVAMAGAARLAKDGMNGAKTMLAMSASMALVAIALGVLAQQDWKGLLAGGVALGAMMVAIAFASKIAQGSVSGAGALAVAAVGVLVLAAALKVVGGLDRDAIVTGLIGIAGGLLAITAAVLAISLAGPVGIGVLLGLAGVLVAVGAAALMFGAGAYLFLTAIQNFTTAMNQLSEEGEMTAREAIANIIKGFVGGLVDSINVVLAGVAQIVVAILNFIDLNGPAIVKTGLTVLILLIQSLITMIPELVNTGVQMVLAFVNGIANAIRENTDTILSAVKNVVGAIIEFILSAIQELLGSIPKIGDDLAAKLEGPKQAIRDKFAPTEMAQIGADAASGIASGMTSREAELRGAASNTGATARDALTSQFQNTEKDGKNIIGDFINGAMSKEGEAGETGGLINNEMLTSLTGGSELFNSAGMGDIQAYLDGSMSMTTQVQDAGTEVASSGVDGTEAVIPEFEQSGANASLGFATGMESKLEDVMAAARRVGRAASSTMEDELDIHSPSRVFGKIGDYTGEGFVRHLRAYAEESSLAGKHVANAAVHSMTEAVSRISDAIDSKIDTSPIITPILDLTNVTKGSSQISAIFSRNQAVIAAREYNDGKVAEVNMEVSNMQRMNAQNMNYMRELAQAINTSKVPVNVQIGLEGDAKQIFKVVRNENDKFTTATNYNPLARQRAVRS